MNDKWTQGELVPAKGWADTFSRKAQKAWSFGVCAFALFALLFMGSNSIALVISLFVLMATGANSYVKNESISKEIQSIVSILGCIIAI